MTATDAIEIVQGDDVDIHPGADVDMLPGQVDCCPELRMGNPDPPSEPKDKPDKNVHPVSAGGVKNLADSPSAPETGLDSPTSLRMTALPNPASNIVTFEIQMPSNSIATLTIYNAHMQEVSKIIAGVAMPAGIHRQTAMLDALPGGIYLCRLQTTTGMVTVKLLKE
jgi:hypothetical protein